MNERSILCVILCAICGSSGLGGEPLIWSEDATLAVLASLNADGAVTLPAAGRPWSVRPLDIRDRDGLTIELAAGAVLEAQGGAFENSGDCLIKLVRCRNVRIIGRLAELRMRADEYRDGSQSRHGIALHGCQDVSIVGLTISDTGGDGIFIGADSDTRTPSRRITVDGVHTLRAQRNGLSIVSGQVLARNCTFEATWGINPMAGVDIEPDHAADLIEAVLVNCRALGNRGPGYCISLDALDAESPPAAVTIRNCIAQSDSGDPLALIRRGERQPTGRVLIDGCHFEGGGAIRGQWERSPLRIEVHQTTVLQGIRTRTVEWVGTKLVSNL